MRRLARYLVRIAYYYSRVIGLVFFTYDFGRQRAEITNLVTHYNIWAQSMLLLALPAYVGYNVWQLQEGSSPQVYRFLAGALIFVRYMTILIASMFYWRQRLPFMSVLRDIHFFWMTRFEREYPPESRLQRQFEKEIVFKFCTTLLADLLIWWLFFFDIWQHGGTLLQLLLVTIVYWICSLINIFSLHYYYFTIATNKLFDMCNDELRSLLAYAESRIILSHHLAKQVHGIAANYYHLHRLRDGVQDMFTMSAVFVLGTFYMNNIAVFYLIYAYFTYGSDVTQTYAINLVFLLCAALAYNFDLGVFMQGVLNYLQRPVEFKSLLEHALTLPNLQMDLYRELTQFHLQLVAYPIKLKMLGLFEFNSSIAFSFLASSTLNAIVLMQYDYKNTRITINNGK